jgi:ribonuclease VapC
MIAIDTSAVAAIAFNEPERQEFVAAIGAAGKVLISAVSVVEVEMTVYARRGTRGVVLVDDLLNLPQFEIVPPSFADMDAAFAAYLAFGKGSGHPAALNFGDVFAYALAKNRDLPLLYKGNEFARTDLRAAVSPPPHPASPPPGAERGPR